MDDFWIEELTRAGNDRTLIKIQEAKTYPLAPRLRASRLLSCSPQPVIDEMSSIRQDAPIATSSVSGSAFDVD